MNPDALCTDRPLETPRFTVAVMLSADTSPAARKIAKRLRGIVLVARGKLVDKLVDKLETAR
jgi:hypothetical protein